MNQNPFNHQQSTW